jgi:hypothetical protein
MCEVPMTTFVSTAGGARRQRPGGYALASGGLAILAGGDGLLGTSSSAGAGACATSSMGARVCVASPQALVAEPSASRSADVTRARVPSMRSEFPEKDCGIGVGPSPQLAVPRPAPNTAPGGSAARAQLMIFSRALTMT